MARQRLSRQSWIDAGLAALVTDGPAALAAEPLARRLGATKGSFYWHFKDVPALQEAVIRDWQTRAFAVVVAALSDSGTTEQRLARFAAAFLEDRQDPAMRAWAQTHPAAATAVAEVDAERLTYLANLLGHLGITNRGFAQSCLAALIGLPLMADATAPEAAFETLIDLVLALR